MDAESLQLSSLQVWPAAGAQLTTLLCYISMSRTSRVGFTFAYLPH